MSGMAPVFDDSFIDPPEYQLRKVPVDAVPPTVSPELPPLTDDEITRVYMAIKRLVDVLESGDRTHLQLALGYLRGL